MIKEYITVNIKSLKPYKNNPRKNDEAVPAVQESIKQCGYITPIVVDENLEIMAGNTRYKALLGNADEIQVLQVSGLTDEQKRKYRLLDNKVGEVATWDFDKLELELEGLDFDDYDFGFDINLEDDEPQEVVEDEVPEEVETRCKIGDIWQLGNHKLICGDSTDPAVIDRLMDGAKAKLLLTDPPYGINADKGVGGFGSSPKTANKYDDEWDSFSPSKDTFDMILEKADNSIIFGGNYFTDKLPLGKCWIVWDKVGDIQFQNPYSDCELAWTNIERNSVKKYTKIQQGFVTDEKEKRVHPTQKPVGMLADILKDFSEENDSVLDCFGGSGSTLIACEQLNRKCYMCEVSEHYCDVIISRYENFTGKTAVKVS